MKITSAQNPLIKKVHKLSTQKKIRQNEGLSVLDGAHLLTEYLKFDQVPEEILISEKCMNSPEWEILSSRACSAASVIEIPDDLMTKIAPTKSPSGILTVIQTPSSQLLTPSSLEKILLLDHLQDPGNVGTLIRSAVAAGFEAVISLNSCELWSPKVLRSAQGAHFYPTALQEIEDIKQVPDVNWYALSCDEDSQDLFQTKFKSPLGLIVGNEGAGLSSEISSLKPQNVHIPMHHNFESLNAAVSGSIGMFEITKRI